MKQAALRHCRWGFVLLTAVLLSNCTIDRSPLGPVPWGDEPRLTMKLHLPWLPKETVHPDVQAAAEFVQLWLTAPWQQRRDCEPDQRLMAAAQQHADWLAAHNAATHVGKDGLNANDRVRAAGYKLPEWYPAGENNIESIAVDWEGPVKWLKRLHDSPYHYDHLSGCNAFFWQQTRYGVGVSAGAWLVLVTAPVEAGQ